VLLVPGMQTPLTPVARHAGSENLNGGFLRLAVGGGGGGGRWGHLSGMG
jgi:hypothetical protein